MNDDLNARAWAMRDLQPVVDSEQRVRLNALAWALREHLGDCWPRGLMRDRMAEKDCWALGGIYIHDFHAHALIGWGLMAYLDDWHRRDDVNRKWQVSEINGEYLYSVTDDMIRLEVDGIAPTRFEALLSAAEAVVAANQTQESK